jgi:hypothetical protein
MGSKIRTTPGSLAAILALLLAPGLAIGEDDAPTDAEAVASHPDPDQEAYEKEYAVGLEAYRGGDYPTASAAFSRAADFQITVDLMFAWAQSERYGGDCRRAIELYDRILVLEDLTSVQKRAVLESRSDCERVVRQADAIADEKVAKRPKVVEVREVKVPVATTTIRTKPWYKDTVGMSLLGAGAVGLGVGAGFIFASRSSASSASSTSNYETFADDVDSAKKKRTIGIVAAASGGAMALTGVLWLVMHDRSYETKAVGFWSDSQSSGLALTGQF